MAKRNVDLILGSLSDGVQVRFRWHTNGISLGEGEEGRNKKTQTVLRTGGEICKY